MDGLHAKKTNDTKGGRRGKIQFNEKGPSREMRNISGAQPTSSHKNEKKEIEP